MWCRKLFTRIYHSPAARPPVGLYNTVLLSFCHRGVCLGARLLPAFCIDACRWMVCRIDRSSSGQRYRAMPCSRPLTPKVLAVVLVSFSTWRVALLTSGYGRWRKQACLHTHTPHTKSHSSIAPIPLCMLLYMQPAGASRSRDPRHINLAFGIDLEPREN